jgi:1,4-dihydroxy-6-naphthoate synthase
MNPRVIQVGHSPDSDDAFMFYALARGLVDTGELEFRHVLQDIETLNRRALGGELEVSAVSIHAYAFLADRYALLSCGASMGDRYGPMVVARGPLGPEELHEKTIAVPGTLTTAFLALKLLLRVDFAYEVVPFDQVLAAVKTGRADAGLVIHEGQLTYRDEGLHQVTDLGEWWHRETGGLPLPLGGNVVRKDLGPELMSRINRYIRCSIQYGLEHRDAALGHAMQYARDLDRAKADRFVRMYVNEWTLDYGPRGRQAVQALLDRGFDADVIPHRVKVEFVE